MDGGDRKGSLGALQAPVASETGVLQAPCGKRDGCYASDMWQARQERVRHRSCKRSA